MSRAFLLPLVAGLLAPGSAFAVDAAIMSTIPNYAADVQGQLLATGQFGSVDVWDANISTPNLNQLASYDVVYLQYDAGYFNATALGDVLADYVDAGGGVVAPGFDWGFPGIGGRLGFNGYMALDPSSPYHIDDRLASNTGGLSGPYLSGQFNAAFPSVAAGATLVASYDDGAPFIAYKSTGAGVVVSVNDYNVSNAVGRTDFWDLNYDGAQLWAGVGLLAAGQATIFNTRATGVCGGAVTINVRDASPNGDLAYVTGGAGTSSIPGGPCAGTRLPVTQPRLRTVRVADAQGRDTINIPALAPALCGDRYVVIDLDTCRVATDTLP